MPYLKPWHLYRGFKMSKWINLASQDYLWRNAPALAIIQLLVTLAIVVIYTPLYFIALFCEWIIRRLK
jgi:hypothetical protein